MTEQTAKNNTEQQFDAAIARCRGVYEAKLKDYGASWRLMRPSSLTDQILIKADRIRSLALIQLEKGFASGKDIEVAEALALYDRFMADTRALMLRKNHDYDEAWRKMRVSSYTDLILMKLMRTKEIEDNGGVAKVSEGVDANYQDMVNYAIFGIIKLTN